MIAFRTFWVLLSLGMASGLLGSVAEGETLRYDPTVGETLQYGIDYVLTCKDEHPEPELRVRCLVRYRITAVDEDHWDAAFTTHPFGRFGAYRDQESVLRMIQQMESDTAFFDVVLRDIHGFQDRVMPGLQSRHAAQRERAKQQRLSRIRNMKEYPGLFQFCSGKMRVSSQGELLSSSQSTQTPMLMGPVVSLPLLRLSRQDESEPFGYRIVHDVNLRNSRTSESTTSTFSLLQTVTPTKSDSPDLATVGIETEIAGGLSAGAELRVTGTGWGSFSRGVGMPLEGEMKYDMSGFSYGGGHSYELQVSFRRLNAWQHPLFDAMLTPNSAALSPENLPRLTPQQLTNVRKHFAKLPGPAGLQVDQALFMRAPVAYGSPEWNAVDEMADRDIESSLEAVETDERRHNLRDAIQTARKIRDRWVRIWKLAPVVHREWSDTSGSFSVTARMLGRSSTHVVLVRSDDGQRIEVPLERLSEEDHEIAMMFGLTPDALGVIKEM